MKSPILLSKIVFFTSLILYQSAGFRKVEKVRDKNYRIKTHEGSEKASDRKSGIDYAGIRLGGTQKRPKNLKAQKVEKVRDKNYLIKTHEGSEKASDRKSGIDYAGIALGGTQERPKNLKAQKVEKEGDNYYLINTAQGSLKALKRKNGMDYVIREKETEGQGFYESHKKKKWNGLCN